jgi:hypothetical protein
MRDSETSERLSEAKLDFPAQRDFGAGVESGAGSEPATFGS